MIDMLPATLRTTPELHDKLERFSLQVWCAVDERHNVSEIVFLD